MSSLSSVRAYFSSIAESLGYQKHYDGFAIDNIPSTRFNKSYHVEAFSFEAVSRGQMSVEIDCPVVVRLFFKGFRNVDGGISAATEAGEAFFEESMDSENSLTQQHIRLVALNSMIIEPYSDTNDNYVVCVLNLTAKIFKNIC
jgi:hypothetical protein